MPLTRTRHYVHPPRLAGWLISDGEQRLALAWSECFSRLCVAAPELADVVGDLLTAAEVAGSVTIRHGDPLHARLRAALATAHPHHPLV